MLQSLRLIAFFLVICCNSTASDARAGCSAPHAASTARPTGLITVDDPETTAIAWVKAFNAGAQAMQTYRSAHFTDPDRTGWRETYDRLKEDLGELTVQRAMAPDPGRVLVGVESQGQGYVRLSFVFDASGKIESLRLGEEQPNPLPAFQRRSSEPQPIDEIDAYLQQITKEHAFSGVVLIRADGEIWFERAYGLASIEFSVPNTIATRFDVGSFNKDYTRLAIMQLAEDGALKLNDTVGEFLPDYPNERVRAEVTIRQLLDHRSGLGDYFDMDYFQTPMQHLREIEDYIPIWGPKPLEYEPGTREQYSNYGYTVLGAVVEAITGMSYPDYVSERIFEPAGMHDTGFFETDGIEPNVAVGYTYMDGTGKTTRTLRKNTFLEPVKGGPWGKSYSTGRDLMRFFDALYSHQLVSADYGWSGGGWDEPQMLAGGGPGLSAMLMQDAGLAIVVLANQDEPGAESAAMRLLEGLR